jgi:hypothetical protein
VELPSARARAALLRAGDLPSLGQAARAVGLGGVLEQPVSVLPREVHRRGGSWYLTELHARGESFTLDQLLTEGSAAEAHRVLPPKERKALVERVRGYLLAAAEAGLIEKVAEAEPVAAHGSHNEDEPPLDPAALAAWGAERGVLGLLHGNLYHLGSIGDVPRELAELARSLSVATIAEALRVEQRAWPRNQAARAQRLASASRDFLARALKRTIGLRGVDDAPDLPEAPELQAVARPLLELRRVARAANAPDAYAVHLRIVSAHALCLAQVMRQPGVELQVQLHFAAGAFTASCRCLEGQRLTCAHVIAAVDGFMEGLANR